jgi:hypothetical protein
VGPSTSRGTLPWESTSRGPSAPSEEVRDGGREQEEAAGVVDGGGEVGEVEGDDAGR